ncbi:MAG: ABC transporter substrate-binding protein, partial [Sphingobium sp.]
MHRPTLRRFRASAFAAGLLLLAACGSRGEDGPVRVDLIGTEEQLAQPLDNGGNIAGQVMLASASQGLVTFDAGGDLIGALAERWIVEDDGESYIFRLRRTRWPDGTPVRAGEVARLLRARFAANPALLGGLTPVVRGMTDEVLEIRLSAPIPSFLQLLAHPAIAIARRDGGTGPFRKTRRGDLVTLTLPDDGREAADADPRPQTARNPVHARPIYVRAVRPALAFARFQRGHIDLALGGRFQHLPYVAIARPPTAAVRADPVDGLLGLLIDASSSDFLADRDVREALAMAVDRDSLSQQLNLAGWRISTAVLPAQLDLSRPPSQPGWAERTLDLRRSYAR